MARQGPDGAFGVGVDAVAPDPLGRLLHLGRQFQERLAYGQRVLVQVGEVGEVVQVLLHQEIAALDVERLEHVSAAGVLEEGEVRERRLVGPLRVAHPDEDEGPLLPDGVSAQPAVRDVVLAGHPRDRAVRRVADAVIAADEQVPFPEPLAQRERPVQAAVLQRRE